jgi:hypothetical protein
MEFESFDMDPTQGEVNRADVQVPKPNVLDELNAYMRVKQVVKDTDPLMWWKHHQ